MRRAEADRYLTLLGVPRRTPAPAALAELVGAHLARVPFENVSKLLQAARGGPPAVPPAARFLDDLERHGLGGTCYVLNPHFGDLLRQLGYDVELHGADMEQPDVHVVNVVRLDGRAHLVDVGYGAPLRAPLDLATAPHRVERGPERWVLHAPARDGRVRLDHVRGDEVVHGYTVTPRARRRADFDAVVADSFRPDASFLNSLRVVRHGPARSVALRDRTARITADGVQTTVDLPDRAAVRDFVVREFGIAPGPLDAALDRLARRPGTAFAPPPRAP